jgi:hypothetical protein
MTLVVNESLSIIGANETFPLIGEDPHALIGRQLSSVAVASDRQRLSDVLGRYFSGSSSEPGEVRFTTTRRSPGSAVSGETMPLQLTLANSGHKAVALTATDTLSIRLFDLVARSSSGFANPIGERSPFALARFDATCTLADSNRACQALFGAGGGFEWVEALDESTVVDIRRSLPSLVNGGAWRKRAFLADAVAPIEIDLAISPLRTKEAGLTGFAATCAVLYAPESVAMPAPVAKAPKPRSTTIAANLDISATSRLTAVLAAHSTDVPASPSAFVTAMQSEHNRFINSPSSLTVLFAFVTDTAGIAIDDYEAIKLESNLRSQVRSGEICRALGGGVLGFASTTAMTSTDPNALARRLRDLVSQASPFATRIGGTTTTWTDDLVGTAQHAWSALDTACSGADTIVMR